MRLVRAFLGASNFSRDADRFTNFDSTDNFPQTDSKDRQRRSVWSNRHSALLTAL
jgi:hypothetical protein